MVLFLVPLPCIVSDWSAWTKPDSTGTSYRYRKMERPPLNGGKVCPELIQMKKGIMSFLVYKDFCVNTMCSRL